MWIESVVFHCILDISLSFLLGLMSFLWLQTIIQILHESQNLWMLEKDFFIIQLDKK